MKHSHRSLKQTAIAMATFTMIITAHGQATPGEVPGPGAGGPTPPVPDRPGRPFAQNMRFAGPGLPLEQRLFSVLTEEQRRSFREVMSGQREKIRELEEKQRVLRGEILDLSLKPDFNEDVLREKALTAGKQEAELTVLRAKAISEIKPPLTPGQIERLKEQGMMPGPVRMGDFPRMRPEGLPGVPGAPPGPQPPSPPPPPVPQPVPAPVPQ